jgi:hypothetical protein
MFNLTRPGSVPQYLNHCFTSALCWQLVVLIGLILTPEPAVADTGISFSAGSGKLPKDGR